VSRQIRITAGQVVALAELDETNTAESIWHALPISSRASTWGEEIYFSIPVNMGMECGKDVVSAGDLGYWPPGSAFCIFFGRTPSSTPTEIRPASAVNVFGKVIGDPMVFKVVKDGVAVTVDMILD
jgi:hypothetical protein